MSTARALAVMLAALALGSGCSWLVNPERDPPRCVVDAGADPCPQGSTCTDGHCRPPVCGTREICGDKIDNNCNGQTDEMVDVPEICNRIDDDCDGLIDEGHDADEDGVTWCGDLADNETHDCDDFNPKVKPGIAEVCDGIDNNCNGQTDESSDGASLCPDGQICRGNCVVPTCAIENSGMTCEADERCIAEKCVKKDCRELPCPSGSYCDAQSVSCVPLPPTQVANGQPCAASSDCVSKVCMDAAALRLPGEFKRVCGQACCNDKQCTGPDEVCFASGTGARSCLPRSLVPVDTQCSHAEDCSSSQRCTIASVPASEARPAYATSLCRAPSLLDHPFGETCVTSDACASKLCVPDPSGIVLGVCSAPCRTSSDCTELNQPEGIEITPILGEPHEYCRFVDLSTVSNPAYTASYAAVCVMGYDTGGKQFGAACAADSECADGVCVMADGKGYCAPTCCSDLQCRGMGTIHPDARCLPMARGGHYEMRCSP